LIDARSRDCWDLHCLTDAPQASVELLDAYLTCQSERCFGAESPEEFNRCMNVDCGAPVFTCVADSYPDSCWGLEACFLRDCEPQMVSECADACVDEAADGCGTCRNRVGAACGEACYQAAAPGCRQCRERAETDFVRAHCSDELTRYQRCADAHDCPDRACAERSCGGELDSISSCFDAATRADSAGYNERMATCYPQPE